MTTLKVFKETAIIQTDKIFSVLKVRMAAIADDVSVIEFEFESDSDEIVNSPPKVKLNPKSADGLNYRIREVLRLRKKYEEDPEYREFKKKQSLENYYRRKELEGIHSAKRGRPRKY